MTKKKFLVESLCQKWRGGFVRINRYGEGSQIVRPFFFVFDIRMGMQWVEPSYADINAVGGCPALHEVKLKMVRPAGPSLIYIEGPEYFGRLEEWTGERSDAGAPIEWWTNEYLPGVSRSREQERDRVAEMLRPA